MLIKNLLYFQSKIITTKALCGYDIDEIPNRHMTVRRYLIPPKGHAKFLDFAATVGSKLVNSGTLISVAKGRPISP